MPQVTLYTWRRSDERGGLKVDSRGQTGINGVFAAGDVTDLHDKQIVIAAGAAGATSALGVFEYLETQH